MATGEGRIVSLATRSIPLRQLLLAAIRAGEDCSILQSCGCSLRDTKLVCTQLLSAANRSDSVDASFANFSGVLPLDVGCWRPVTRLCCGKYSSPL